MLHLTPADYTTMPWKNGGGTTTEILVRPAGLRVADRFLYRVSVADVASNGPFSTFPGYERHLVLVDGAGMTLTFRDPPDRRLALRPFEPVTFSGDDPATGSLEAGPVRDFNLIVDRARAHGSLACLAIDAPTRLACDDGETCVVHILRGDLDVAGQGHTLVLDAPLDVVPCGGSVRLAVARVTGG